MALQSVKFPVKMGPDHKVWSQSLGGQGVILTGVRTFRLAVPWARTRTRTCSVWWRTLCARCTALEHEDLRRISQVKVKKVKVKLIAMLPHEP